MPLTKNQIKAHQAQEPAKRTTNDKGAAEIKRLWGELEVIDAAKDLRVMILPEDVDGATRQDPACCVFARACQRSFGATKVLFFRSVAYVELPDENGNRRVERFNMPPTMRALIEAFDRGETVIPKAGFTLKAVPPGDRFEHVRLRNRRSGEARKNKIAGTVERQGNQGLGKYRDAPITIDLLVRSGTGAVHFTTAKPVVSKRK